MVRCSSSSSLPDEDINKMVKKEPSMPPTSAGTAEVKTILGTMTFGWSYSSEDMQETASEKLLEFFIEESGAASSVVELDTASAYAGGNTEEILGRIFSRMPKEKLSKYPWQPKRIRGRRMASVAGEGGLQSEKFFAQVGKSLSALHPKSIDILYLHAPDSETTLFEVLETAQGLYRSGAFKYLGLSNMSAWEVLRAHALCKENQWVICRPYIKGCTMRDATS